MFTNIVESSNLMSTLEVPDGRNPDQNAWLTMKTPRLVLRKSGVVLRRRAGLRQLLQDVASGSAGYRAILVTMSAVGVAFRTRLDPACSDVNAVSEALKPYDGRMMRSFPVSG